MEKTGKYFFENVIPHKKKINSTKIEFKDSNIYFEQKKNNLVFFCQNINKIVLTVIFSFFLLFLQLIMFFISETTYLKKK